MALPVQLNNKKFQMHFLLLFAFFFRFNFIQKCFFFIYWEQINSTYEHTYNHLFGILVFNSNKKSSLLFHTQIIQLQYNKFMKSLFSFSMRIQLQQSVLLNLLQRVMWDWLTLMRAKKNEAYKQCNGYWFSALILICKT